MAKRLPSTWTDMQHDWPVLTAYQRFETLGAFVLTILIAAVIMTVLIALEFNHTLQDVLARERGIIQARTVVLIALLALARKVIIIDLYATAPRPSRRSACSRSVWA